LGIPFDIHCGGIDHILIHHTNEIAQAEAVFGQILARYWLHCEFLVVEGKKMAKSLGNIYTLDDLIKRGFDPLAYRYLCLGAHYRSKLNFTFEALKYAQNTLENLYEKIREIKLKHKEQKIKKISVEGRDYQKRFLDYINDDLNTPKALALMWDLIKNNSLHNQEKYQILLDFDKVFGLKLKKIGKIKIPRRIIELAKKREIYRQQKKWKEADIIREKIKKLGYWIEDTKKGPYVKKL